MKTVTLCGSMRFEGQMQEIALKLETRHGMNVLQCVYNPKKTDLTPEDMKALAAAHYRKIDLSEAIYVVDLDGYIGESVKQEIAYAEETGKEVFYHSAWSKKA